MVNKKVVRKLNYFLIFFLLAMAIFSHSSFAAQTTTDVYFTVGEITPTPPEPGPSPGPGPSPIPEPICIDQCGPGDLEYVDENIYRECKLVGGCWIWTVVELLPPKVPVCGDNLCERNETSDNCCTDCGCPEGYVCESNNCVLEAIEERIPEIPVDEFFMNPLILDEDQEFQILYYEILNLPYKWREELSLYELSIEKLREFINRLLQREKPEKTERLYFLNTNVIDEEEEQQILHYGILTLPYEPVEEINPYLATMIYGLVITIALAFAVILLARSFKRKKKKGISKDIERLKQAGLTVKEATDSYIHLEVVRKK